MVQTVIIKFCRGKMKSIFKWVPSNYRTSNLLQSTVIENESIWSLDFDLRNSPIEMVDEMSHVIVIKWHGRFDLDDIIVSPFSAHDYSVSVHLLFDEHSSILVWFPWLTALHELDTQKQPYTPAGNDFVRYSDSHYWKWKDSRSHSLDVGYGTKLCMIK